MLAEATSHDRRRASPARAPSPAIHLRAVTARSHQLRCEAHDLCRSSSSGMSETRRSGATLARNRISDRQRFPMPATTRWSSSASAIGRCCDVARRERSRPSIGAGSSRMSGPRFARRSRPSSRTGPFHRVASCVLPSMRNQGRPVERADSPSGRTSHRPRIMRWLRRTSLDSKRKRRFLPLASTPSSRLAVKLLRDAQRSRTWMNGLDRDDVTHEWSQRSRDRADSISLGHRLGQAG